ncbi:MAG: fasciclin domain-containing protein, partial [Acidobacteria bacterium]|nr:fasciclin domain-containing protein [Acidobacteriota bacterium]
MYRSFITGIAAVAMAAAVTVGAQEKTVMVGGAAMYPSKDIVDNAVNSKDHTTLVAAVKAAGLVETLKSAGPFTVFAPTNAAFNKLPKGTVETLLKPENNDKLKSILTYHVVAGRMDSATLMEKAQANGGKLELSTVNGGKLWAALKDGKLWLRDAKGNTAAITIADVYQSNGVIHVINTVVM